MSNPPSIHLRCLKKYREYISGNIVKVHFGKANQYLKTGCWEIEEGQSEFIINLWNKRYGR